VNEQLVDDFDQRVDAAFDHLRGRPEVDRAAAAISNLADYGLVWVAIAGWKARRRGAGRRRAVFALGSAGFSSLGASRLIKSVVDRQRPEQHLDANVRTPTSSSFPSGHTMAAFCTAIVLSESEPGTAAALAFAGAVAVSRVHLRAHHPSDVVGGAAAGTLLGLCLRPVVQFLTPGNRSKARRRAGRRSGMRGQDYLLKKL
jgi:membrane-associated phospholipid phosphatase